MTKSAYYQASIQEFVAAESDAILGALAKHHRFSLEQQQKFAWQFQVESLKRYLPGDLQGSLFFEFSIPRMGKRADVVLMTGGVVFVIEFKVGSSDADRYAVEQVHDYALDLKNFHRGSHHLPIVPILIPTAMHPQVDLDLIWDADMVAKPVVSSINQLPFIVQRVIEKALRSYWMPMHGPTLDTNQHRRLSRRRLPSIDITMSRKSPGARLVQTTWD